MTSDVSLTDLAARAETLTVELRSKIERYHDRPPATRAAILQDADECVERRDQATALGRLSFVCPIWHSSECLLGS